MGKKSRPLKAAEAALKGSDTAEAGTAVGVLWEFIVEDETRKAEALSDGGRKGGLANSRLEEACKILDSLTAVDTDDRTLAKLLSERMGIGVRQARKYKAEWKKRN